MMGQNHTLRLPGFRAETSFPSEGTWYQMALAANGDLNGAVGTTGRVSPQIDCCCRCANGEQRIIGVPGGSCGWSRSRCDLWCRFRAGMSLWGRAPCRPSLGGQWI